MIIIKEELDENKKEGKKERALKLGDFYEKEGLYDEAIKNYELYMFYEDESKIGSELLKKIGICYSFQGMTAEAINNFKKANKLVPEDTSILYLLAQMYTQAKILDEAEKYYKKIIELGWENPAVYYNLGEIAYKQGEMDESIKCWKKVVEIEPTNNYANYLLGAIYYYKKEYKLAKKYFVMAHDNGFRTSALYNYLGKVYNKLGEIEKSKTNFLIASEKEPYNSGYYKNYLKELSEEELKDEEEKLYERLEAEYTETKYKMALLYLVKGNIEKGKEILKKILEQPLPNDKKNIIEEELHDVS
ncbi:tetratricopeptide repeat protein [Haliovirga abyssi]|uniref:Tetratricopeptide repeat protein n=1 Tax=Haliovirga abyssi TaxID=2996794 RepID=A0AAU9DJI4_9FUSO|nr:tetratricopeptide repeat protein [Haliovirga abyssi]BDU51014.1 hypothetical protein HLVA_15830 [Haliovirga abyssi]